MRLARASRFWQTRTTRHLALASSLRQKEVTQRKPLEIKEKPKPLEQDPAILDKVARLKEQIQIRSDELEKKLLDNEEISEELRKVIIEQRLDDYVPPLNVEDDSADGLFDEEHLDVVNKYLEKTWSDKELFYHDLKLGHIESYKKRTFYKMVHLFQEETGETRKGYIEFTSALLYNLKKFDVDRDLEAYRQLLHCFPQSPYTGIKRNDFSVGAGAFWQDRYADHELAELILQEMFRKGVHGDNALREFVLEIFGRNSMPYVAIDNLMFWNPRFAGFEARYNYNAYVQPIDPPDVVRDPVEASFKALRQMVPGIYTEIKRFPINENLETQLIEMQKKNEAEIKKLKPAPYETKLMREAMDRKAFSNAIISCQSDEMLENIAKHDEKLPIIISGPNVVFVQGKRIKYYSITSAAGGDFDMSIYEDPDQYQKLTYDKWWKSEKDVDKILWDTSTDLSRIQSIHQKTLPSLSHLKGQVEGDLLWEGHSQLDEIDEFEEPFEASTYAIATFGSDGSEAALLQWIRNLALTERENYETFKKVPIVFQKSILEGVLKVTCYVVNFRGCRTC